MGIRSSCHFWMVSESGDSRAGNHPCSLLSGPAVPQQSWGHLTTGVTEACTALFRETQLLAQEIGIYLRQKDASELKILRNQQMQEKAFSE